MRVVKETGWLEREDGDPLVQIISSVRRSKLQLQQPLGVVWHTTDTLGVSALTLAKRIQLPVPEKESERGPNDRFVSWHVIIGRDGTVIQSVPFTFGSWHVKGTGRFAGADRKINGNSIGIELENAGRLMKTGGKFYMHPWKVDPRLALPASHTPQYVRGAEGGYFEAFTLEQEASATKLLRALVNAYHWDANVCGYGHCDFTSAKEDPGLIWLKEVLPRILDRIFPVKDVG